MTADAIVGRAAEIDAVDRLVCRLADGPAALVLEGLPGIGKTTVWRRIFGRADREVVVLSCRPVEAEAKLAFASLADLLEPVTPAVLSRLPEPQRLAARGWSNGTARATGSKSRETPDAGGGRVT